MTLTGLSGFANLRVRPGTPSAIRREVHRCSECGQPINSRQWEVGLCCACEDARDTAETDKEIAKAEAMLAAQTARERGRSMEVAGVKLRPVDPKEIPGRQATSTWGRVVDEFLASGAEAVAVEAKGDPHAHQTALGMAIRKGGKTKEVYATCRSGRTYLVRVKPKVGVS